MPRFILQTMKITVRMLGLFFLLGHLGYKIYGNVEAVHSIKKLGGLVLGVAQDNAELEVDLHLGAREKADEALAHVARLQDVVSLHLGATRVTDAGLVHLKNLRELRRLHLEQTAVSDMGLMNLRGLDKLEYLNLYGTKISDKSVEHMKGLKGLKHLYLWQTKVTDQGVKQLQEALPLLQIERGADLTKIAQPLPPIKRVDLKWIVAGKTMPPKSVYGTNISVIFENKSKKNIKLFWVSYEGDPKLYGEIAAGRTRDQNTYGSNTWLVCDEKEKPFGYFITGQKDARALIPSGI
jgi:hypothetical protein